MPLCDNAIHDTRLLCPCRNSCFVKSFCKIVNQCFTQQLKCTQYHLFILQLIFVGNNTFWYPKINKSRFYRSGFQTEDSIFMIRHATYYMWYSPYLKEKWNKFMKWHVYSSNESESVYCWECYVYIKFDVIVNPSVATTFPWLWMSNLSPCSFLQNCFLDVKVKKNVHHSPNFASTIKFLL